MYSTFPRTLVVMAWLVTSASSAAAERQSLTGYGEILFGMPESALREKVSLEKSHDHNKGGVWLKGVETVGIVRPPLDLLVLVDQGIVKRVSLVRLVNVSEPDCWPGFQELVRQVASEHGAPDSENTPALEGIPQSHEAVFRFADGSFIEVQSSLVADGAVCADSIVHFAAAMLD